MQLQNVLESLLPFKLHSGRGVYMSGWGLVFFIFFQGWTAFASWNVEFFMKYIIVLVFVLLFTAWKVWHRTLWVTRVNS